ncbi:hypothetical protein LUZ61_013795 [Rhynchospora tenuis]|uniref:RING-type E3 ubiquitin transferase n=1 Tax=Rhynchospora tenuis TaxID=198213 RepID=A0AAD5W9V0_9POAL|nr:hypothetical protein LUZ61_013795 [Rhynchospora tenuis]
MGSQQEPPITKFWCHECSHIVSLVVEPDIHRLCPFCFSSFIEELNTISPDESSTAGADLAFYEWIPVLQSLQNSSLSPVAEGYNESNVHDSDFDILQKKVHRDAVIQKLLDAIDVINRHHYTESSLLPYGLYHYQSQPAANTGTSEESFGPQLNHILEYLSENPPSWYHADDLMRPKLNVLLQYIDDYACAIEGISTVRIDRSTAGEKCPICLDEFVVGQEASKVPCKHMFHCKCIKTWLELHSSCPVCRFELPVEVRRSETGDGNIGGRSRRRGRRFWVHCPWLSCMSFFRGRRASSGPTSPLTG